MEFRLTPDDLSAIRFGMSPGHELVHAVRALARPHDAPLQWGWVRHARERVPAEAFALLRLVIGDEGYAPDFLTSPPTGDLTPEAEFARIRAADPALMRVDLRKRAQRSRGPSARRSRAWRRRPRGCAARSPMRRPRSGAP